MQMYKTVLFVLSVGRDKFNLKKKQSSNFELRLPSLTVTNSLLSLSLSLSLLTLSQIPHLHTHTLTQTPLQSTFLLTLAKIFAKINNLDFDEEVNILNDLCKKWATHRHCNMQTDE
jgi:hypothetical protein